MSSDFENNDFEAIGSDDGPPEAVIKLPPMSEKARKRAKRKRRFIFWMKLTGFFLVLFLIVGIIGAAGAFFYCKPRWNLAHSFDLSELEKVEVASLIYDRNGDELGSIFVQNRRPVSIDEVSDNFIEALLAAEDSRFYEHDGVDRVGILRAVYYAVRSKEWNQGASTITQQLAKQSFELKDRTISRKVTEVFLAQRIEKALGSKEKILELYLNRIYFGSGYYGIASASRGYFGKDPAHLSVVEGATLAACIPNPYHRSPRSYPETSKRWRNHVLTRMEAEGYIDKDALKSYKEVAIRTEPKKNITGKSAFVYEKVRQEVRKLLGEETVSKGGFKIYTSIDSSIQALAESTLKEQLANIEQHPNYIKQHQGGKHSTLAEYKAKKAEFRKSASPDQIFPAPDYLQGAIMLIENKTGSIIAQVGGRDFSDSQFDRISQGKRPVGTTFKPFVYATAFENGDFPGTLIDDTALDARQVMIGGTTGILGEWGAETHDNTYEGRITARTALAKSKNAATVRLGQQVGTSAVVELAEKAGLQFEGDLKKFNATLLGRNPASPEDLCLAYTIFPNNGKRPEKTHIITNIKDSSGNLIYSPHINMSRDEVIDQYTAYQINSILEDTFDETIGGTGSMAKKRFDLGNYPVAGKSGTEYSFTDNWFVGYTTEVTCLVWTGFDQTDRIYTGAFSTATVLPIWTKIMNAAAEKFEPRAFLPPPDAEQVDICRKSGELATDKCWEIIDNGNGAKNTRTYYTEHLRPGTRVNHLCHIHGGGGSNRLTRNEPIRATHYVEHKAQPVFPTAPTIIGTDDPYNSLQPVVRAQPTPAPDDKPTPLKATPIIEEEDEEALEPTDRNGIPIARPAINEEPASIFRAQRIELPPPRAIEFE